MLDTAVLAALAVLAGGVMAVSARDGRIVVLGVLLVATTSAVVATDLPGTPAIGARVLGALLAGYLLWAAAESGTPGTAGSAFGPLAEASVGVAAFLVGLAIRPVDPLPSPIAAQAAGMALVVLAVVPLAGGDVFRMGVGVAILTVGCSLLLGAWSGPLPDLEQLALAGLLIGIAGATRLLIPTAESAAEAAAAEAEAARTEAIRASWAALERLDAMPPARSATLRPAVETDHRQAGPLAPERRPRPMTADPLEDDWLAWAAPEPAPRSEPRPRAGRHAPPHDGAHVRKPDRPKPSRDRPDRGGQP